MESSYTLMVPNETKKMTTLVSTASDRTVPT
jgi:hypothetical protein